VQTSVISLGLGVLFLPDPYLNWGSVDELAWCVLFPLGIIITFGLPSLLSLILESKSKEEGSRAPMNSELEKTIAAALSGIFATLSTLALSMMAVDKMPSVLWINYVLAWFGLVSIIISALLIDWVFDNSGSGYHLGKRLKMMNGSYTIFAVSISLISIAILVLYYHQKRLLNQFTINWLYILFVIGGIAVFFKIMTKEGSGQWLTLLIACFTTVHFFSAKW
jgi:hypothetical protein